MDNGNRPSEGVDRVKGTSIAVTMLAVLGGLLVIEGLIELLS